MKQIELYTAAEQDFLKGVLELLEIDYTEIPSKNTIDTIVFRFDPSNVQFEAIAAMMKANYQNMIKN